MLTATLSTASQWVPGEVRGDSWNPIPTLPSPCQPNYFHQDTNHTQNSTVSLSNTGMLFTKLTESLGIPHTKLKLEIQNAGITEVKS